MNKSLQIIQKKNFIKENFCFFNVFIIATVVSLLSEAKLEAMEKEVVFEACFEDLEQVEKIGGEIIAHDKVEFKPGKVGNAAYFTDGGKIIFELKDLNYSEGTIEFWEKIRWPEKGKHFRCVAKVIETYKKLEDGGKDCFLLCHSGNAYGYGKELVAHLYNISSDGKTKKTEQLFACCPEWDGECWRKISLTYKLSENTESNEMKLYIDGVLRDTLKGFSSGSKGFMDTIVVGGPGQKESLAIDELKFYSFRKVFHKTNQNLISNYSFEHDINDNGSPDFWNPIGNPGAGYWGGGTNTKGESLGINIRTDKEFFSGKYSVRMEGKEEGVGGQIIGQIFGVRPDTTYEIDAAVKTSLPGVNLLLRPYDFNCKQIIEKIKSFNIRVPEEKLGQWLILSEISSDKIRFHVPKNCRYLYIYLLLQGQQTIYWDDIYFVESVNDKNQK